MTIKKTAISTSMVLAMGLSLPLFAQTEEMPKAVVDGDTAIIECIPQAEVDAMNAADKEKLTLAICEDVEAAKGEMNKEGTGAAVTQ